MVHFYVARSGHGGQLAIHRPGAAQISETKFGLVKMIKAKIAILNRMQSTKPFEVYECLLGFVRVSMLTLFCIDECGGTNIIIHRLW